MPCAIRTASPTRRSSTPTPAAPSLRLDTDSDSDGTADCNDACPTDAAKTAAGVCGVADTGNARVPRASSSVGVARRKMHAGTRALPGTAYARPRLSFRWIELTEQVSCRLQLARLGGLAGGWKSFMKRRALLVGKLVLGSRRKRFTSLLLCDRYRLFSNDDDLVDFPAHFFYLFSLLSRRRTLCSSTIFNPLECSSILNNHALRTARICAGI